MLSVSLQAHAFALKTAFGWEEWRRTLCRVCIHGFSVSKGSREPGATLSIPEDLATDLEHHLNPQMQTQRDGHPAALTVPHSQPGEITRRASPGLYRVHTQKRIKINWQLSASLCVWNLPRNSFLVVSPGNFISGEVLLVFHTKQSHSYPGMMYCCLLTLKRENKQIWQKNFLWGKPNLQNLMGYDLQKLSLKLSLHWAGLSGSVKKTCLMKCCLGLNWCKTRYMAVLLP